MRRAMKRLPTWFKPRQKTLGQKMYDIARSQIGVTESPPFSNHVEYTVWYGLIGPAGMPQGVVKRLNAEAVKSAGSNAFRGRREPLGFEVITSTPDRMAQMLAADSARWAAVIKAAGVTVN